MPNDDETHYGPTKTLKVLRAFVTAHAVPNTQLGAREPIWYLPVHGDLMHHALGEDPPAVDAALIEEMHTNGFINIEYGSSGDWKITPTASGRRVVDEGDRLHAATPTADVSPILAAIEQQVAADKPLAWPAVRPVLDALRAYWQASGYPDHGISLTAITDTMPADYAPLFAATMRSLTEGEYLSAGTLSGRFIDDDGRSSSFPAEVTLTEKARTILDGWPGAASSELVDNLLAVLTAAAADEQDPVRRRRLEALASAVRDVGVSVASQVLSKVIAGGL